jgi:multicomponent Na+:H+ antiporter subunit D
MWFTAGLFLLGAWGLVGAPPFGTLLGEGMISHVAEQLHDKWLGYVFMFAEVVTCAAVLRVTFRIFFGWGEPAPSDESSRIEEKAETAEQHGRVPAIMFVPAAVLIILGIAITAVPHLRTVAHDDARLFTDQSSYARMVLDNASASAAHDSQTEELRSSIIRSCVALAISVLLAFGSVFREDLGKAFAFTRSFELGNSWLRKAHSGHPGDYVAWLSFGTAVFGLLFMWFMH